MALLEARGLVAGYGLVTVLHGIDLEVGEGETVALIGANGAGKTTALRALSGLLRPRDGEVLFGGQPVHRLPAHRIARLGLAHVPEGRGILTRLTVRENLLLGTFLARERPGGGDALAPVLSLFPRLAERLHQAAGTLSGGEQQMLALARAFLSRPRLLFLDEPSLGLSPIMVEAVYEVIRVIAAQGTAILLVEQNVSLALAAASRAYVLAGGVVTAHGAAAELRRSDVVRRVYLGEV